MMNIIPVLGGFFIRSVAWFHSWKVKYRTSFGVAAKKMLSVFLSALTEVAGLYVMKHHSPFFKQWQPT